MTPPPVDVTRVTEPDAVTGHVSCIVVAPRLLGATTQRVPAAVLGPAPLPFVGSATLLVAGVLVVLAGATGLEPPPT
jgi:hypothetical protein